MLFSRFRMNKKTPTSTNRTTWKKLNTFKYNLYYVLNWIEWHYVFCSLSHCSIEVQFRVWLFALMLMISSIQSGNCFPFFVCWLFFLHRNIRKHTLDSSNLKIEQNKKIIETTYQIEIWMNKNNNEKNVFGKCVRLMVITEAFNLIHVVWWNLWTQKTHTWTKYERYSEEPNKRSQEKSKSVANSNYLQWKLHKPRAGAGQFTIFTQQSWIVSLKLRTMYCVHVLDCFGGDTFSTPFQFSSHWFAQTTMIIIVYTYIDMDR